MKTLYFPAGVYPVTQPIEIPPPPTHPPTAVAAGEPESKWINVKDYGAVGDGLTDDTDAINAAIEELNR